MRLEFAVATHFLHLGHEVAWPELDHSSRNDLFVRDLGRGLQLECKAFSKDIGRRVLQRDAVRFYGILKQQLHGVFRALTAGLVLVLTVPDRLPTAYSMKVQLAKEVRAQVLKGTSGTLSDGSDLRIDVFDTGAQSLLTSDGKPNRDVIDEISGVRNEHALVHTNGHGAVVLVVQSAKDDKKKDAILRRLETAAEQLDSRSPGVVVAGLDSLTAEELQDLSTEDRDRRRTPTVLRVTASDFLGSASAHVVGMVWLSRGDFVPREDGVSDQGAAYWFPRQDSLFWDGAFEHSFGTAKSS